MAETVVSALHFVIYIGSSFSAAISWRDNAGVLMVFPEGTTAEADVRPYLTSPDVLVTFLTTPVAPTDGRITLTNPGVTTLALTAAQTALLTPANGAIFDLRYSLPPATVTMKLTDRTGLIDIREVATRG